MNPSPTVERARKYVGVYITIILLFLAFGSGILAGRFWQMKKQVTDDSGNVEITKVLNMNRSLNKTNSVDFSQFWDVWDKLKKRYVDESKETELFYGAMQGLVSSLEDPYSMYLPPKDAYEFSKGLSGKFEGIGCEIGIKNKQLSVVSPLPDSPAEKAGLRPGDFIIAVNGTSTLGMDINTAVLMIRGKSGTEVVLKIVRDGLDKPKDIKIIRAKINIPAVLYSMKDNKIAYLRIMQFNGATKRDFDKYVKKLKSDGAKGVVLDLRSNPGGYLQSAVDVVSQWAKRGEIVVSQKGRSISGSELKSNGPAMLAGLKTVVLVNRGSASASEIVAGALQDYNYAKLIGEKTYGKGSVQDFEVLPDGSALKLTVAEWFTPKGNNINKTGVKPDIEIKEEWSKQKVGEDKILDTALKLFASSTYKW
jgi:carboxyl-terminal processing protease